MEIVFDTQSVTDAGFDTYLIRAMFPTGTTAPTIETRFTDASNLVGGTIGGDGIIYLGSKLFKLDGSNRRITISDGNTETILIGYV